MINDRRTIGSEKARRIKALFSVAYSATQVQVDCFITGPTPSLGRKNSLSADDIVAESCVIGVSGVFRPLGNQHLHALVNLDGCLAPLATISNDALTRPGGKVVEFA